MAENSLQNEYHAVEITAFFKYAFVLLKGKKVNFQQLL